MTQEDILNNPEKYDLSIETVGKGTLKSPMKGVPFVSESERVSLTADVGRIQDFCKRGIVLKNGRMEFDGNLNEAIAYYDKMVEEDINKNRKKKNDA